jgi:uncharacterized membrane protein
MKLRSPVTFALGAALVALGIVSFVFSRAWPSFIPTLFGGSLAWLGWRGGRVALLVFGHVTVVLGFVLIVWGIYLLPHSQPTAAHIFGRPLFWGMFATGGGVCAIYHGFCRCIRKSNPECGAAPPEPPARGPVSAER